MNGYNPSSTYQFYVLPYPKFSSSLSISLIPLSTSLIFFVYNSHPCYLQFFISIIDKSDPLIHKSLNFIHNSHLHYPQFSSALSTSLIHPFIHKSQLLIIHKLHPIASSEVSLLYSQVSPLSLSISPTFLIYVQVSPPLSISPIFISL